MNSRGAPGGNSYDSTPVGFLDVGCEESGSRTSNGTVHGAHFQLGPGSAKPAVMPAETLTTRVILKNDFPWEFQLGEILRADDFHTHFHSHFAKIWPTNDCGNDWESEKLANIRCA